MRSLYTITENHSSQSRTDRRGTSGSTRGGTRTRVLSRGARVPVNQLVFSRFFCSRTSASFEGGALAEP